MTASIFYGIHADVVEWDDITTPDSTYDDLPRLRIHVPPEVGQGMVGELSVHVLHH